MVVLAALRAELNQEDLEDARIEEEPETGDTPRNTPRTRSRVAAHASAEATARRTRPRNTTAGGASGSGLPASSQPPAAGSGKRHLFK